MLCWTVSHYGNIADAKWNIQHFGDSSRKEGFAGTSFSNKNNVRFFNFDVILFFNTGRNTFVMVINCYGENFFSIVLPDYILI